MAFHWSLSDSTFPQVSSTLLSILADLNNAVVWVFSNRSFISKVPVSLPILCDCTECINYNWYHHSIVFHLSTKVLVLIFLYAFFPVLSSLSAGTAKSSIWQVLFLFIYLFIYFFLLTSTRSGRLAEVTRLYFKISENFVHLILQERSCVVFIPFLCMVKF